MTSHRDRSVAKIKSGDSGPVRDPVGRLRPNLGDDGVKGGDGI